MLHLTPEILEASYELLRATPPFRRWGLPDPDDVEFHVIGHPRTAGRHWVCAGKHHVQASHSCISQLDGLVRIMAHEMIHIRETMLPGARNDVEHGRVFQRLADQVCRYHGFDRRAF